MTNLNSYPLTAAILSATAARKVDFLERLERGEIPELLKADGSKKEDAVRKNIEAFDRALNCPARFESAIKLENGLMKLFAYRNNSVLEEDLMRVKAPSKDEKHAYASVADLCMFLRLAAFISGMTKEKLVSYGFNGKPLRKFPFGVVPPNYFAAIKFVTSEDVRQYETAKNGCEKLACTEFTLEQIKACMSGSSANTDASSFCQILRFCNLVETEAYNRKKMHLTADAVRMLRKFINK